MVKFCSTLIALVLLYSSSAQEIYSYGYFQNEIPQIASNPVIADDFSTGEMSIATLTAGPTNPSTVLVTFHETTGEVGYMKKHISPRDLILSEGIVANNEFHVIGLFNRNNAVKDPNRGAFSMVIDAQGNIRYYEEIRLTGTSASVEEIQGFSFDGTNFYATARITETNASGNPDYTAVLKINLAGRCTQITRINDYTELAASAYVPSVGLYVFEGNNRQLLDNNLVVTQTDILSLNPGERVYKTRTLGQDSVYLFTEDPIAGSYSVILWQPTIDAMTRIMNLSDRIYKMELLSKNGASFYLASAGNNRQCHYQLDAFYDTLHTAMQVFGPNTLNGCNSALICQQELITYSSHPDSGLYYICKSGNNWFFLNNTYLAPAIFRTNQAIFQNIPGTLTAATGNVTFTASPVAFSGSNVTPNYVEVGYNPNCGTLAILPPTYVACNEEVQLIAAAPVSPNCLPPNITRTYFWEDGTEGIAKEVELAGTYTLTIIEGGCSQILTTQVSFEYVSLSFSGKNNFCLDYNDSAMIHVSSLDAVNWNSTFATPTDSIYTRIPGYYLATAVSASGFCLFTDSLIVYELCDPEPYIYVPNAFTPDGDGINDLATASMLFIEDVDFRIYNRWGQLIHQTSNPSVNWDGTFEGTESPIGVYVWIVDYSPLGDTSDRRQRVGHFVLVR